MKLPPFLKWLRPGKRAFKQAPKAISHRNYPAAAFNRLTADWNLYGGNANSEVRFDIEALRERGRQLERSDPLMQRAISIYCENVLKPGCGFTMQNQAAFANGRPDLTARKIIEEGWKEWCRPKNASQTGEDSFAEICRLALHSTIRDGGYLIRKIIDPRANRFGFTLATLEIDYLDINMNEIFSNGNKVIMGVEKNRQMKTVAYHLLAEHPQDMMFGGRLYQRRRIPAEEIIHYFVKTRDGQCVGVPWGAPSMLRMHHLEKYIEAEIIAARAAANKGGYFTSVPGDKYSGENEQTVTELGTKTTGTLNDSEPGQFDELPAGMSFVPYDPTHPTQQFGDFITNAQLGICAGFNLTYANLVGDLTKSSFSSMRTGTLSERRTFMKAQGHMIEHLACPVFEAWLETSIASGAIQIPMSRYEQVNYPNFRGTRWDWVDPEKDLQAIKLALELRLKTRDAVIDESNSEMDLEETFEQIAYEEELAKELKIDLEVDKPAAPKPAAQQPEPATNGNGRY